MAATTISDPTPGRGMAAAATEAAAAGGMAAAASEAVGAAGAGGRPGIIAIRRCGGSRGDGGFVHCCGVKVICFHAA